MPHLEIHLLQQFPPSLVNRGEDGAPKAAHFGGVERQRWSAQSQKKSMRDYFRSACLLPQTQLSLRTNRLPDLLTKALAERGHPWPQARMLALNVLWGANLLNLDPATAASARSNILLFIAAAEIDDLAARIDGAAPVLATSALPEEQIWPLRNTDAAGRSKRQRAAECPKEFQVFGRSLFRDLDPSRAVDLALFGRLIAQAPTANVDGALAVAHGIGTHPLIDDLDYFTTIDDLAGRDEPAAGHLGIRSLTSSTIYRYASLNLGRLADNLRGDADLAAAAAAAVWQSAVHAQPTAMRTSTAPHTRPVLVFTVLREDQPLSLANAFARPTRPDHGADVSLASVRALAAHWRRLGETWGHDGVLGAWHTHVLDEDVNVPGEARTIREHGRLAAEAAAKQTVASAYVDA